MRKLLRRGLKSIVRRAPVWMRDAIVQRAVKVPHDLPDSLVFKIASTPAELEEAFKLVYECYLPLGYCSPNILGMRATIYHALPTTTTLIVLDAGKVVGALTMVRDNRLGLPLERVFQIKNLRKKSSRVAEITSLVIHKDYRRTRGGSILFPMLKQMYTYATSHFGVNQLVVTIHPRDAEFYKSLLRFQDVPGTGVTDYLGAPAIALHLDLHAAVGEYQRVYGHKKDDANWSKFFMETSFPNLVYPAREYNKINDPVVSYEYYQQLFVKKLRIESDDRRSVEACFRQSDLSRAQFRVDVEAPAKSDSLRMTVKDVSRTGFRAYFEGGFIFKDSMLIEIEIGSGLIAHVTAKPIWMAPERGVGFEVLTADENWNRFITFLYRDHFNSAA